ncbi:levanase-like protein, partial [Leptotrombidium deliense]
MYAEPHRPRVHFSLPRNWMNDPNGLVYANGVFHLFYQHNPFSSVWGPMHWGHAISEDLIHWKHLPTALKPNELGTIFSGCAVVDDNNVTGLQGQESTKPLIAIFTQHLESSENVQLQQQCLAYSVDNGYNWM